jgi:hypothetical protein
MQNATLLCVELFGALSRVEMRPFELYRFGNTTRPIATWRTHLSVSRFGVCHALTPPCW